MTHIESEISGELPDCVVDDSLAHDSVMIHVRAIFLEFYRPLKKNQFPYK